MVFVVGIFCKSGALAKEVSKETKTAYLFSDIVTQLPLAGEAVLGYQQMGKNQNSQAFASKDKIDLKPITVATIGSLNTAILQQAIEPMAQRGYQLQITQCEDYATPNIYVEEGKADCNFFQHAAYLERYNLEHNTSLLEVAKIHYEPMAICAGKATSLSEITKNSKIAVPAGATGLARALLLLQQEELLDLMEDADLTSIKEDIASNPLSIELVEMEEEEMMEARDKMDAVICHTGYALQEGTYQKEQVLAMEDKDSLAASLLSHGIVVKEELTDSVASLIQVLQSKEMAQFIAQQYQNTIYFMGQQQ